MEKPAEFVDLERYPITSLESARGRALVSDIQNRMAASCICALPGFLRPEALVRMVAEAEALEPMSHSGPTEASPYFFNYGTTGELNALPPNHPRKRKTPRSMRQIALRSHSAGHGDYAALSLGRAYPVSHRCDGRTEHLSLGRSLSGTQYLGDGRGRVPVMALRHQRGGHHAAAAGAGGRRRVRIRAAHPLGRKRGLRGGQARARWRPQRRGAAESGSGNARPVQGPPLVAPRGPGSRRAAPLPIDTHVQPAAGGGRLTGIEHPALRAAGRNCLMRCNNVRAK